MDKIKKLFAALKRGYLAHPIIFLLRIAVVAVAISFLVIKRSIWTPDTLLVIVLVIGIVFGRARDFVVRFLPFLGLLVLYDSFRSIADNLNSHVNYVPMIDFDRFIAGGAIPTQVLQSILYHPGLSWYDFYFYFLYTVHFLVPVVIALVIWKWRPKLYWPYVISFVALSFAAFATFVIFPAAPPWLAHQLGYFGGDFHRISSDVWQAMGIENFSEVYGKLSPNEVAAVPSLHSAYPLLCSLFLIKAFSFKKVWWILIYPISLWVGVVYLGEHYVFDVVVAIVFTVLAYIFGVRFYHWYQQRHQPNPDFPRTLHGKE